MADWLAMRDALGGVQSVLVLGGASELALATTRRLIGNRCRTVVLAVRDPERVRSEAAELQALGADQVEVVAFDAADAASHVSFIDDVFDRFGDIDLVLSAFGVLGDQADFEAHPETAAIAIQTNFAGAVSSGLAVANRFRAQGHGTLVVISSVAGERPRRTNFVYGSSKAGLDAFAQGLGDSLVGSGAQVLVVRPGFVTGRMTAGRPAQPFATTPEAVAEAIERALERRSEIIWVPGLLRWVFAVMRHLPRPVWRIVSAR